MLDFCANRVMALQELQASGTMARGFLASGCYRCSGRRYDCGFYTPLGWVYESADAVPENVTVFVTAEEEPGRE